MRLLLTSAGIKNESIHASLLELLGKPIAVSSALIIPTATYAFPGGAHSAWKIITGRAASPLCELGWKSVGVLELTALPSIDLEHWVSVVEQTDALLVGGGDPLYLCYWMRQSGLAGLFPTLTETVYVGVSAGSLVMGPCIGGDVADLSPLNGGDSTLGLVDFAIFPHVDHPDMPDRDTASAERWASGLSVPGYAIDDETAIKVVDGVAEVVSEGHWQLMTPSTDCG
jgi:dipeptidase E